MGNLGIVIFRVYSLTVTLALTEHTPLIRLHIRLIGYRARLMRALSTRLCTMLGKNICVGQFVLPYPVNLLWIEEVILSCPILLSKRSMIPTVVLNADQLAGELDFCQRIQLNAPPLDADPDWLTHQGGGQALRG